MTDVSHTQDGHMPAAEVGTIIEKLHTHRDEIDSEYTTLEVKTYDDGGIKAELFGTVDVMPGAGTVMPAAIRQIISYDDEDDTIEYFEVLDRQGGGETETRTHSQLEQNVLAD